MRQFDIVVTFLPWLPLIVGGVTELRSGISRTEKVRNCVPITLGLIAYAISFNPRILTGVDSHSSLVLSRAMTMFCATLACSGVFITFSRRRTAILMACAGLMLTYIWLYDFILT